MMKKRYRPLLFVATFTLLLLALRSFSEVGLISAQTNFRGGQSVTLSSTETINSNYYAAGDNVTVSGTVNGDVFLAGGNITVDGTINGDVIAAGGNLDIKGTVTGNVRAAGGQINISGLVGRNISVTGGQININDTARIAGNVTVAGGQLRISSTVPGRVVFAGGQLQLNPTAQVSNIDLYSQNDALVSTGATISGQIQKRTLPQPPKTNLEGVKQAAKVANNAFSIISFISALAFGLLLTWLFPEFTNQVASKMSTSFWPRLGIGFLSLCLLPIAFIFLLITIVGIPFAFISLAVYFLLFYFSKIFAAVFLGRWLNSRLNLSSSLPLALLTGLIVYYLLGFVPFLGGLAKFGLSLAALGTLLWPQLSTPSSTSPAPASPVRPPESPSRRLAKK